MASNESLKNISIEKLDLLDIDIVREIAATSTDDALIAAALQKLIDALHYTTKMDKFITFNAPSWLIEENNSGNEGEMSNKEICMRRALALHKVGLPVLAKDSNYIVRAAAAFAGYIPELMINDPNPFVRAAIACKGFGIDRLVNDKSDIVRANVAINGYCLDALVNDKSPIVRRAVASKREHLEQLIDDPIAGVREEVATTGFGLTKLIKDEDPQVRMCAANSIIARNAEKANRSLLNSDDECVRKALASMGYHLPKLANDRSPMVRAAVAQKGYRPEQFAKDESPLVRAAAVSVGYVSEDLIHDPSVEVRVKLATEGYNPFVMCKDESPLVRGTIALYGHENSRLMNDKDQTVAKIAIAYHNGNFRKAYASYNTLRAQISVSEAEKEDVKNGEQAGTNA